MPTQYRIPLSIDIRNAYSGGSLVEDGHERYDKTFGRGATRHPVPCPAPLVPVQQVSDAWRGNERRADVAADPSVAVKLIAAVCDSVSGRSPVVVAQEGGVVAPELPWLHVEVANAGQIGLAAQQQLSADPVLASMIQGAGEAGY
jgi:hypothetical protein